MYNIAPKKKLFTKFANMLKPIKNFAVPLFLLFFSCIAFNTLQAQTNVDSTQGNVYDLVYLVKGGILKGEIQSFDEEGGGLVFKDIAGRTYSLAREEYDYFIKDKYFPPKKKKKDRVLNPRKFDEWSLSLGLGFNYLSIPESFTPGEYYLNSTDAFVDPSITINVGLGKYINGKHYVGANAQYALVAESNLYYSAGVRYAYYYDAAKSNVTSYIPVEMKFSQLTTDLSYDVNDTLFFSPSSYTFPAYEDVETTISSVQLGIGHGFGFVMANKKMITLEAQIVKHFPISTSFVSTEPKDPQSEFDPLGVSILVGFQF